MQEIRIDEIRKEDASAVAALENQIFSDAWTKRGIQETLEQKNVIVLGAWRADHIVGYVILYYVLDEGEIARIAVDKDCRRQGVAGCLLHQLQEKCMEKDIVRIMLDVRAGNAPAIAFYRRHGFEKDGIRKGYYANPGEDALLMSKTFDRIEL